MAVYWETVSSLTGGTVRYETRAAAYLRADIGDKIVRNDYMDGPWMVTVEREPVFTGDPALYEAAAKDATLGVGHVWTVTTCPAYATLDGADCTCNEAAF